VSFFTYFLHLPYLILLLVDDHPGVSIHSVREAIMPYRSLNELPESVRDSLPHHAQEIYKEAFNSAWDQYDEKGERREGRTREETAHAVAWAAVKKNYEKISSGNWKRKERDD
jgi:cation transport regulator